MLYAHKILAGRAEPRLTGIGGISSLKASSGVEEGLEGFLGVEPVGKLATNWGTIKDE